LDVSLRTISWGSAWDRLMSALKGRHAPAAPDVFQVEASWVGTLAHLGLLRDLTSLRAEGKREEGIREEGIREEGIRELWESCRFSGRLFAVPWTADIRVLRVRRDGVEEAGMSQNDLATWEGLEELARRAAAMRRPLFRSRRAEESVLLELAPWVWAGGGRFFSADGRRPEFLSEEALKAFSFYRDLSAAREGRGEPILEMDSLGAPAAAGRFVEPLPRGPSGRFTCLSGTVLGVAAGTSHIEESTALLRHLASPRSRASFAQDMGLPPAAPPEEDGAFREALAFARPLPSFALLGGFERLFHRRLSAAARDAAPWEAWRSALERVSRETEVLLTHYEPPA